MAELQSQIIMYFGTTNKSSGHHITMLSGNLSISEQTKIGNELDSDENLYSDICKANGISYVYYRGVTMLCVPYSIHDDRGGCKTMFIMNGKVQNYDILRELKKYSWVYSIFNKLKIDHKFEDIIEVKLTI